MAGGIALVLLIFVIGFMVHYSVKEIVVVGNTRVETEDIIAEVQDGFFGNNTFFLSKLKAEYQPDDLELVESIQVQMTAPHSLRVTVQEIQLIGYVQFLDCNMYFDVDGTVVNSTVREEEGAASDEQSDVLAADEVIGKSANTFAAALTDIPRITGLDFSSVRLGAPLPVEDESVFNTILGVSRMLNRYGISPEYVEFDEENQVTLYIEKIAVQLGRDERMEEKLARAASILPMISGKSGVLHLEDYDGSSVNVIFSEDTLAPDEEPDADEEGTAQPEEEGAAQPDENTQDEQEAPEDEKETPEETGEGEPQEEGAGAP